MECLADLEPDGYEQERMEIAEKKGTKKVKRIE